MYRLPLAETLWTGVKMRSIHARVLQGDADAAGNKGAEMPPGTSLANSANFWGFTYFPDTYRYLYFGCEITEPKQVFESSSVGILMVGYWFFFCIISFFFIRGINTFLSRVVSKTRELSKRWTHFNNTH